MAVECSLDFLNLKAAPEGSLVAQPIPKCIAAHFFSAEEMAGTVNDAAGPLMKARPSCSLALSSGRPGPGMTQPLLTAGSSVGCSLRGFSFPPEKSAAASVFSHSGVYPVSVCVLL